LKLLFVSNLFPDAGERYRGLDNATLLHHLASRWDIRVLALRPTLPWATHDWRSRDEDSVFSPGFVAAPYLPKIGSRWNHRLLTRALRSPLRELRAHFAFDAVLASWLFPDACGIAELAPELGFPFAAIAQGSDTHQYLRHPIRRKIMTRLLPNASTIVTRSAELARLLADAGLPRERLQPIYNGVDHTCFAPGDQTEARRELGLPVGRRSILFVGNFYAVKNPLLLVEAHARLLAEPGFHETGLVMAGSGPLEKQARQLARRLGTSPLIHFASRLDAASVARHMRAADVLCLPSRNEGVPNVILEAFACGLPVVASRVGGIPEVHHAPFLGRLVAEGNAPALVDGLRAVLQTSPDRNRIHAHARQFSWQNAANAYHEVLLRCVR